MTKVKRVDEKKVAPKIRCSKRLQNAKIVDGRKPGCEVIVWRAEGKSMEWLRTKSGLSAEYCDKILRFKNLGSHLSILFDDTAKCFEAMQQFNGVLFLGGITCPHGQFRRVIVKPPIYLFSALRAELQKYGEIIELKESTEPDVYAEALMLLRNDSKLLDPEWMVKKKERFVTSLFVPRTKRVHPDLVSDLWDKFRSKPKIEDEVIVID